MIRNEIICAEQPQFKTNCELLWISCANYNPKEDNQESLLELRRSVQEVQSKANGNIWILGDVNLTKCIPTLKPD